MWQFFGTHTDSTFSRYSPGFNSFPVLTLILTFFRSGPDNFSALARIPPFAGTPTDSTMFRYCHTPIFFFLIIIIIIYSSTKQLILKYSISALKSLNVEFLLEFVQKEDMENLL